MKKLIFAAVSLGMSSVAVADSYDISSGYIIDDGLRGEVEFRVDEGGSASFSGKHVQNFTVALSKKAESQVLLGFSFAGGDRKTEAEVILDLDREVELTFGGQTFKFLVKKHAS